MLLLVLFEFDKHLNCKLFWLTKAVFVFRIMNFTSKPHKPSLQNLTFSNQKMFKYFIFSIWKIFLLLIILFKICYLLNILGHKLVLKDIFFLNINTFRNPRNTVLFKSLWVWNFHVCWEWLYVCMYE